MDKLGTYLNDHLGGATGGLELARRARASNKDNEFGELLEDLVDELEEERDGLISMIKEMGYRRDRLKVAGGWLGEKFARLKPNDSVFSYSPLSRLIELEGLTVGVAGKRSMWINLQAAGVRTDAIDFVALKAQADSQLARLEPLRKKAAIAALAD